MVAEVDRDGYTWQLSFLDRVAGHFDKNDRFAASHELAQIKKIAPRKTGTRVRFWPDWDIFDADASIDIEQVRDRVATMCFLVPGLKVVLVDKRAGGSSEPEEFVSRGGLADYVDYLSVGENVTEVITLTGSGTFEEKVPVDGKMQLVTRECKVEAALRWIKGYDTVTLSFVNTIPTAQGGTHVAGFDRALGYVINDVLLSGTRNSAVLAKKGEDRAKKEDVQEGLVAVVKVTFPEPQFRGGQTRIGHSGGADRSCTTSSSKACPIGSIPVAGRTPRQRVAKNRFGGRQPCHVQAGARGQAQSIEPRLYGYARQARRLPHPRCRQRTHHRRGRFRRRAGQGRRDANTWRSFRCGARWSTRARRP